MASFKKFDEFSFVAKLRSVSFVLFVIEAAYAIVTLATGFNFLAVVGIAFSMFFALLLLFQSLRNYINIYAGVGYITSALATLIYCLVWGAGTTMEKYVVPALCTIIPIIAAILVLTIPRIGRLKGKRVFTAVFTVFMLGVTVFYFLAGSFRAKPLAESMQKGHDDYLNSLENNHTKRPNVLFVLMDDMGYADISMYSYLGSQNATIQTPNIDSIATDNGIYFDNFYASSPVCSPSRFGILTGRYCSRGYLDNVVFPSKVSLVPFGSTRFFNPFQFLNNVDGILGDEITIAEALSQVGYNTALIGKWNLGDYGEYLPTNQGFDYFFGSHYVNDMTPYNMVVERNGEFEEVYSHAEMKDQSKTTSILTTELNKYISEKSQVYKSSNGEQPFFAYYCTPWPHAPLYSSNNTTSGDLSAATQGDKTDDSYVDCIEEFDRYLGTTIQTLKDEGVYDDTIIIFTSDNGPGREGATGALKGRKNTTFEGGHKVPFLIHYPAGFTGGERREWTNGEGETVGSNVITASYMNIDIFPTILDMLGLPLPTDRIIDGVSMMDVLTGEKPYNETVVKDGVYRPLYYIKKGTVQSLQMAIEVDVLDDSGKPVIEDGKVKKTVYDFKYYLNVRNENSAFIDQVYRNYLFNLDIDPIEAYNVSMTYTDAAATMKNQLLTFRKELKNNRRGIIR